MNPLTLVKRTQKITERETALGISEEASWHAKYKDSAYIFVGGIPFDLTEGDLLAVFAQYGEIVDVNLVRDKGTGKSKGFAFIAYEDQRSTILAVDNLNGAQILGRIVRVDHVSNYKKKEEEDEETQRQKREARGVCRAFQRGECTRGAACKFSHDEQRAANTGWGERDKEPRWGHDRFEGSKKVDKRSDNFPPTHPPEPRGQEGFRANENGTNSRVKGKEKATAESYHEETERRSEKRARKYVDDDDPYESRSRYSRDYSEDKRSRRHDDYDYEPKSREDRDRREEKRSRRHDDYDHEPRSREDHDRREERREDKVSRRRDDSEPRSREDRDRREERREENVSRRHDDSEYKPRSREDRDRRDKRSRRH